MEWHTFMPPDVTANIVALLHPSPRRDRIISSQHQRQGFCGFYFSMPEKQVGCAARHKLSQNSWWRNCQKNSCEKQKQCQLQLKIFAFSSALLKVPKLEKLSTRVFNRERLFRHHEVLVVWHIYLFAEAISSGFFLPAYLWQWFLAYLWQWFLTYLWRWFLTYLWWRFLIYLCRKVLQWRKELSSCSLPLCLPIPWCWFVSNHPLIFTYLSSSYI